MSEGQTFFKGSHELPMEDVARTYDHRLNEFHKRCSTLGGMPLNYGDASFRITPFPKIPAVLITWNSDDEFPARDDLLFDSTCSIHLPMDIIWSTAMMTVNMVFSDTNLSKQG
ncbi:DUF3786 domain-containing protein [Chloroflexota bacterium]